jgi:hypothetical protein
MLSNMKRHGAEVAETANPVPSEIAGSGLGASSCSRCPVLEAERDQAYESLHFANGTAELAMKHRNEAEAVIEKIRNLVTTDHESKDAFIRRVQACLPIDPFIDNTNF